MPHGTWRLYPAGASLMMPWRIQANSYYNVLEVYMVNGLDGTRMLIALFIGIAILIVLVLKTKVQAFLALILTTVLVGVIGGMPLLNITLEDGKTFGIINSITSGFGGTLGSIGIIIGFGVMMGQIFTDVCRKELTWQNA